MAVMLAALSPIVVSCYGEFPLTKTVYRVNGDIPNGLLRQIVFWVLVIIPVYGVAILADAIVLNLIEFWTGEAISVGATTGPDGSTVVLQPSSDGREAWLTVSRDDKVVARVRFVKVSDTVCEVRNPDGSLAGMAVWTPSGDLQLTDAEGRVLSVISAAQVAGIRSGTRPLEAEAL